MIAIFEAEEDEPAPPAARCDWPEWMAPPSAAKYLNTSTSTLAKLRLRGGGPTFCRIGRAIRYRRTDLDGWLLATRRRSTSDPGLR
jgi:excisionase family DNA binding protein